MILIVGPNTPGHANSLKRLGKWLEKEYPWIAIHYEWIDYSHRTTNDPKKFVFANCAERTRNILENYKNIKLVIYDFFAIEGYIFDKVNGVKSICNVPAVVGEGILSKHDKPEEIVMLEREFDVEFPSPRKVNDGWLFDGDTNLVWNHPSVVPDNLRIQPFVYVSAIDPVPVKKEKLIYFSLGTVVPTTLISLHP